MNSPKKIVILGAGFAGIYGALSAYKECGNDVAITIINRTNYFLFTPMLHEVATGGLGHHQVVESIRQITYKTSISFLEADVLSVDVTGKTVVTDHGSIEYDVLVVAIGAQTNFFNTPGAAEHTYVLKNLKDAINIRDRIIDIFEQASRETDIEMRKQMLSFVIVGGGATGVELAAEIAELCQETLEKYYVNKISPQDTSIALINAGPELLSVFDAKTRAYALKILRKNNVTVLLDTQVKEVAATEVVLGNGARMNAETIVWTAGVKPNEISVTNGEFKKDAGGRIVTDKAFRVQGFDHIFAVGDVAHVDETSERGLPMLAQVAVREGNLLGKNIARCIAGKEVKEFSYHTKGELVSLGRGKAAGTIAGIHISGRLAWFIWRTVYLFKFISGSKRFRIAFDWTMQLFSKRDVTRA